MSEETARRRSDRERLWTAALARVDLAGKVALDAGTGEGWFTRFLAERDPRRLVSVTCLTSEIPIARQRLGELAGRVEFLCHDLTQLDTFADAGFDFVGADFLVAAVASLSPYREVDCLKELARVLRPGGRIVITGWEAGPPSGGDWERSLRSLFQIREAAYHLQGVEPFREHPSFWVERRLAELGVPAEEVIRFPDVHHDLSWLVRHVERAIEGVDAADLRGALGRQLAEHADAVQGHPSLSRGLPFGQLYAVVGCKLAGGIILSSRPA